MAVAGGGRLPRKAFMGGEGVPFPQVNNNNHNIANKTVFDNTIRIEVS